MIFTGQHHIMNQLKFLLPDLYKNSRKGANFLLRGPSGYGKTTLAISICQYLAGNAFEVYTADEQKFRLDHRVIFIDEVHELKNFEFLYPMMDKAFEWRTPQDAHVFIFATNIDGKLPEAFRNRCTEFIFDDYSLDELLLIARDTARFQASDEAFLEVIEAGNRNPRIIKSLIIRLSTYFSENPSVDSTKVDFKKLLSEIFLIEDGLDVLCRRYMDVLHRIGGVSSLSRLKAILHVDEETIVKDVEPVLLQKNLIDITRKGRSLNYDNLR